MNFESTRNLAVIALFAHLLVTSCVPSGSTPYEMRCVSEPALELAMEEAPFFRDGRWPEINWWESFGDCQLNSLMSIALENNPTLQKTEARIHHAYALYRLASSKLYPTLFLDGDVTRQQFSRTGVFAPIPGAPFSFPLVFTQTEVYLNFNYEIDLWGKNKNHAKSAFSELQARIADRGLSRLFLSYSVAESYFLMQNAQAQVNIQEELVSLRKELVLLAQSQVEHAVEDQFALKKREYDLATAISELSFFEENVLLQKHLLHALIADDFEENIEFIDIASQAPFQLPENLPLDLIAHRPDMIAKLWRLWGAAYEIGVAKAGFYPNFNLTALGGYQTLTFQKLFNNLSTYGNAGPAFSLPLFEGGALVANLDQKRAEYELALLDYNQGILTSVREVLDAMTTLDKTLERTYGRREAAKRLEEIAFLTEKQLDANMVSKIQVLEAKAMSLEASLVQVQLEGASLVARLELIRALGAGYIND